MTERNLTQDRLKELLDYDPDTGIFRWRVKRGPALVGDVADNRHPKTGYIRIRIDYQLYPAHRLAWLYVYGEFPENDIDHIDHSRQNNSISNLRDVSRQDNSKNQSIYPRNTTGITGVCWDKSRSKWSAEIQDNKRKVFLGRFDNIFDAAVARKSAELKYGYHSNHGNMRAIP